MESPLANVTAYASQQANRHTALAPPFCSTMNEEALLYQTGTGPYSSPSTMSPNALVSPVAPVYGPSVTPMLPQFIDVKSEQPGAEKGGKRVTSSNGSNGSRTTDNVRGQRQNYSPGFSPNGYSRGGTSATKVGGSQNSARNASQNRPFTSGYSPVSRTGDSKTSSGSKRNPDDEIEFIHSELDRLEKHTSIAQQMHLPFSSPAETLQAYYANMQMMNGGYGAGFPGYGMGFPSSASGYNGNGLMEGTGFPPYVPGGWFPTNTNEELMMSMMMGMPNNGVGVGAPYYEGPMDASDEAYYQEQNASHFDSSSMEIDRSFGKSASHEISKTEANPSAGSTTTTTEFVIPLKKSAMAANSISPSAQKSKAALSKEFDNSSISTPVRTSSNQETDSSGDRHGGGNQLNFTPEDITPDAKDSAEQSPAQGNDGVFSTPARRLLDGSSERRPQPGSSGRKQGHNQNHHYDFTSHYDHNDGHYHNQGRQNRGGRWDKSGNASGHHHQNQNQAAFESDAPSGDAEHNGGKQFAGKNNQPFFKPIVISPPARPLTPLPQGPTMQAVTLSGLFGRRFQVKTQAVVRVGDHVIFDGDRGFDLGIVQKIEADSDSRPRSRRHDDYHHSGGIIRKASREEVDAWNGPLSEAAASTIPVANLTVRALKLQMHIRCAVFQFDQKKLTFFYDSESNRVDFRKMLPELYSKFRCRIWMERVDELPNPPPELPAPKSAKSQR